MVAAISCGVRVGMLAVILGNGAGLTPWAVVTLVLCGILIGIVVRFPND